MLQTNFSITRLCRNKTLTLDVASHVTSFSQLGRMLNFCIVMQKFIHENTSRIAYDTIIMTLSRGGGGDG